MQIDHPNIISVSKQMEWFEGKWSHILIVKTDLCLDTEDDRYDAESVSMILSRLSEAVKARKTGFHKIKLEEN